MLADFRLKTEAFAPRSLAIAFGHPLPATTDPKAFGSLQLSLQRRMRNGELELSAPSPVTLPMRGRRATD
jgi:hypothetical protein